VFTLIRIRTQAFSFPYQANEAALKASAETAEATRLSHQAQEAAQEAKDSASRIQKET